MASDNRQPLSRLSFLYKGTAMPYLAVFNGIGIPVKNPLTGIPLGAYISNFFYEYQEEKENQAQLTFDVDNPNILDSTELREGNNLVLQWGYIYSHGGSISSRAVPITIRDIDCRFDSTGVHVTLVCIDNTSYLRSIPPHTPTSPEDIKEGRDMVTYMDQGLYCNMGIVIEKFL